MSTVSENQRPLRVALLGAGTVGAEVARLLLEQSDDLEARVGAPLELVGAAVRDVTKPRPGVPAELITNDPIGLIGKGVDVVVEVMGGIEPARSLIIAAMESGASVVTANKALLAEDGATLYATAEKNQVDLYFEASVAGAIPLLRPLRESLAGDQVKRVLGIVNGTTNFILTKMDEDGAAYADVLAQAQALGYAEADPTADVEAFDAAAKAAILAQLAFHTRVTISDVHREGITRVTAVDIEAAREMGFVIKLLAVAERITEGDVDGVVVRVHPTLVPRSHPLASVRDAFNAVFVEAEAAGELMFYGRGAGGAPTASAVLGDVVAAARNKVSGTTGPGESIYTGLPVLSLEQARTRYYLNLEVLDRPGVLATVARVVADSDVSIQVVRQDGTGNDAHLVLRTHAATEGQLSNMLDGLRALDVVTDIVGVMRVEGEATP